MPLPEIPDRFYAPFVSVLPDEDTLRDVGIPKDFGSDFLRNTVTWSQHEAAYVFDTIGIPDGLAGDASKFFGYTAAQASMEGFAADVAVDVTKTFAAAAQALGAFKSVPIIGWIVEAGLMLFEMGKSAWIYDNTKEVEGVPLGYSKGADTDRQQDIINAGALPDQTDTFSPSNDAAAGVESVNVEITQGPFGSPTRVATKIYVPKGSDIGLGILPGTDQQPLAWQWDIATNPATRNAGMPWVVYRPGSQAAGIAAWNGVLANTRRAFLVDGSELAARWDAFWAAMEEWAYGDRYKTDKRHRLQWACNASRGAGGSYPSEVLEQVPAKYFSKLPGSGDKDYAPTRMGFYRAEGRLLTMRGLTRWIIDTKLRQRQFNYLGTLTCAYCSEKDPAFSDATMRLRLLNMRKALLKSPARRDVELGRVVDVDYRTALWNSTLGLKAPEGPAPTIAQGHAALPTIPGADQGDAPTPADPLIPSADTGSGAAVAGAVGFLLWLLL